MRIGRAHYGSAILENLNPGIGLAQLRRLPYPNFDDGIDFGNRHFGQSEIMARRIADDTCCSSQRFQSKQRLQSGFKWRRIGQDRGEIVCEDEGAVIVRIALPIGSDVARAKITLRIIRRERVGGRALKFALPGAHGALRRNQNPFVEQGIVAAMWMIRGRKRERISPGHALGPGSARLRLVPPPRFGSGLDLYQAARFLCAVSHRERRDVKNER